MNEDVYPIKHGDFPASHLSFPEGNSSTPRNRCRKFPKIILLMVQKTREYQLRLIVYHYHYLETYIVYIYKYQVLDFFHQ